MEASLKTTITVREICDGFVYNELEGKGLFGLSGKLTIQPEYQRNYIYATERKEAAVIESLLMSYPLGLIYFNKVDDDKFEVLDGQQRITSIGRFVTNKFAVKDENGMEQYFDSIAAEKRAKILETKLLIYECTGTEPEIKQWFWTINIVGIKLNNQELYNAVYSGPFVTLCKEEFSNSRNSNIQKWSKYIIGSADRQDFLERALQWVSENNVVDYMARHRRDTNITEVKTYFNTVIDWISSVFKDVENEMRGLEWGRLYKEYHSTAYNPNIVTEQVRTLYADPYVKNRKGIFEYILGGRIDKRLLDIRIFDEATKRVAYQKQTTAARAENKSNCPYCAMGHDAHKTKLWQQNEMDADHVSAWSKGGVTSSENCQMLCIPHNRSKGNR